jgi:hypothetical protein
MENLELNTTNNERNYYEIAKQSLINIQEIVREELKAGRKPNIP